MKTPDWILEGYDSEEAYDKKKGINKKQKSGHQGRTPKDFIKKSLQGTKTFKIRKCGKCGSDEVSIVVGEEAKGKWECRKCGWKGTDINEEELTEDEFMKYLDEKGEETA